MKYIMDIVFLDTTSKKYYDRQILENKGMGGTEASVVRIAEGLGGFGLSVCVVQTQVPYFPPTIGQFAYFMHGDDMENIQTKHFVQIRGIQNSHLFPKAKHYIWLHDEADDRLKEWSKALTNTKAKVLGVSNFHKKQIEKFLDYSNTDYIYNPVPDEIYSKPRSSYNKNNFIWAASAHKGLGNAVEVFKKIKEHIPLANLIITNPGYHELDTIALQATPGVSVYGSVSSKVLWNILRDSLCLFYPSQYNETFCCLLSESQALGVPFLGYARGALKEVSTQELVEDGNERGIVDTAVSWYNTSRPEVKGNDKFKLSNVVFKWIQILSQ